MILLRSPSLLVCTCCNVRAAKTNSLDSCDASRLKGLDYISPTSSCHTKSVHLQLADLKTKLRQSNTLLYIHEVPPASWFTIEKRLLLDRTAFGLINRWFVRAVR